MEAWIDWVAKWWMRVFLAGLFVAIAGFFVTVVVVTCLKDPAYLFAIAGLALTGFFWMWLVCREKVETIVKDKPEK